MINPPPPSHCGFEQGSNPAIAHHPTTSSDFALSRPSQRATLHMPPC